MRDSKPRAAVQAKGTERIGIVGKRKATINNKAMIRTLANLLGGLVHGN